jgi:hypothetical protein
MSLTAVLNIKILLKSTTEAIENSNYKLPVVIGPDTNSYPSNCILVDQPISDYRKV